MLYNDNVLNVSTTCDKTCVQCSVSNQLFYGCTAAISRVNTKSVPLFPRPMRKSSSMNVVSSHPLSFDPRRNAKRVKKPSSRVNPLLKMISHFSKVTIERFVKEGDARKVPDTQTRPKSNVISLVTVRFAISKHCFTTRLAVSTVIPAAETEPLAWKDVFDSSSSEKSGFHAFCGKREDSK